MTSVPSSSSYPLSLLRHLPSTTTSSLFSHPSPPPPMLSSSDSRLLFIQRPPPPIPFPSSDALVFRLPLPPPPPPPLPSLPSSTLMLLEMVCQSVKERVELLGHGAVILKKILKLSQMASEWAVKILYSLAKFFATTTVVQEMLEIGILAKLCLGLQVESGIKMKEKAIEEHNQRCRVSRQV